MERPSIARAAAMLVWGTGVAAALIVLFVALSPFSRVGQSPAPSTDTGGPLKQVTLRVDGMACPTCSYRVEKALVRLPGVEKVEVSLWRGEAVVRYKEGAVTPEQMIEGINQAGYAVRPLGAPR